MAKILIKPAGTYEGRKQFQASVEGYDIIHGPRVTISQRWRIQKYGNQKGKRAGPDDEYEIIAKPALTFEDKPKIHLGYSTLKDAKKIASDWLLTQPDYDEAEFERKMAEAMRGNPMKNTKKTLSPATDFNRAPKRHVPHGSRYAVVLRAMSKSGHRKKGYNKDMTRRYNPARRLIKWRKLTDRSLRRDYRGRMDSGAEYYLNYGGEKDGWGYTVYFTAPKEKFMKRIGRVLVAQLDRDQIPAVTLVDRALSDAKAFSEQHAQNAVRSNPSVGDYFHAAKRSASVAVRGVAAKAAAAAHAESKRERKVTPEQALQTLAKSLGFSVVRGNPQKELRRYAVYRLGAHPAERPLWTGNATSGRHAQIQAERATGKDVGEARLVRGGSSLLRKNSK